MYLEIKDVSKKIDKQDVLCNINMSMEKGKIYGLKGKNGCGKTMIMRAICGLINTSGKIEIDGKVIGKDCDFPPSVGALIENPGFINRYSAFENLKILAAIQGKIGDDKIIEVLRQVGLDPNEKKKVKKYSLGMKQKLGIAGAIMEEPDLIILDEPTNALDESSVKRLRELLEVEKKRGALIIISSHDAEELEYLSDKIFFIENGSIKDEYEVPSADLKKAGNQK